MHLSRCQAPVAALLVGVFASAGTASLQGRAPVATVEVLLTLAPTLPALARAVLLDEATGIWARADVAIEWRSPVAILPPSGQRLRVLIVPRPLPYGDASSLLTLGRLVRPDKGHAVAFASIDIASRIVGMAHQRFSMPFDDDERRLGLVLGRAVAHEIGHYLLNTAVHSPIGLMRASFHPRELADFESDAFALDADGAASLRERLYSMNQ